MYCSNAIKNKDANIIQEVKNPLNTFNSSEIILELIKLNRVTNTKVLNTIID